ncbi:hypothetical protein GCM10029964_089840 [Kibdelosporangium lantanae]
MTRPLQITDELAQLRFYLRTSADSDGSALYRLFHQGLADHLRTDQDTLDNAGRVLDGLLATVPVDDHGRRWDLPDPLLGFRAGEPDRERVHAHHNQCSVRVPVGAVPRQDAAVRPAHQQRWLVYATDRALSGDLAVLIQGAVLCATYCRRVIGEYFPQASEKFDDSVELKSTVASKWQELLDSDFLDTQVVIEDHGVGSLVVSADWPDGSREALTEQFSEFVDGLWSCLDSLVNESVSMFSVRQRLRAPERPRFFPMADSEDGLAALLEESCLDGVLHAQYKVIVDAQPFWGAHENPHIQNVRTALAQLLDWRTRLDEGSQVGAWVTPVEPTLQIAPPIEVQNFDVCGPGELLDRRDIVHFRLANYAPSASVQGQAGSYVDLAFADGFEPTDAEDTFQRRTKNVLDAVLQLMAMFTELVHQVPGSRQLATSSQHTTGWIDANASSWYWSAEQLSGLAASDFGVGVVVGAEHTTLLVRTEQGVFERSIPAVTPLNRFAKRGIAAERAVQDAAATWGLPDFVMAPLVERKGRGVREISDGLLVVGDRGLVVQVKSRDGEPQSLQKETSWITKKIAEAGRQVDGTVRRLSSKTTTMVNGRGRNIDITGTDLAWTGVVIIDHPAVPEDLPAPEMSTRTPTVALVRRDWEFLFHQLRSTRAVIDYLARVVSIEARLGHEPERYYELAAADTQVEPTTVDREIYPRGTVVSLPCYRQRRQAAMTSRHTAWCASCVRTSPTPASETPTKPAAWMLSRRSTNCRSRNALTSVGCCWTDLSEHGRSAKTTQPGNSGSTRQTDQSPSSASASAPDSTT